MPDGRAPDRPGDNEPLDIDALIARFAGGLGKVGVIELGYVGLPLVRSMADLAIICTDHDPVDYALLSSAARW